MTTRRSFFRQLALGVAAFGILPSAVTYARTWKPLASGVVVPAAVKQGEIVFDMKTLTATVRQLFDEQSAPQMYIIAADLTRQLRSNRAWAGLPVWPNGGTFILPVSVTGWT